MQPIVCGLIAMWAAIAIPYCGLLIMGLRNPHWSETIHDLKPKHPDEESK